MGQAVSTLERGHIYFFYKPRVGREEPEGLEDVQNLYLVLSPHGKRVYRLGIVGRERLPDPKQSGRRKFWGFIDAVSKQPRDIVSALGGEDYETKTRGERHQPAARPVGEGVYQLLRHEDHTHLAYALELPEQPGEVQEELRIAPEASYIISIKNPEKPSPRRAGLPSAGKAEYPRALQDAFRDRRFGDADPPELLDYEGAEFILISASDDVKAELGVELNAQDEDASSADIFRDLHLRRNERPTEPLFEGTWK